MAMNNRTENSSYYAHIYHMTPPLPLPPTQFQPQPPPYFAQIAPPQPVQSFGDYSKFHQRTISPWSQSCNMAHSSFMEYLQKHPPFQPLVRPPYELLFQPPDPQLLRKIATQIDYYFSWENLIKDAYLRQNMDEYGWVPIRLIAVFNRIKQLTNDIPMILHAIRTSSTIVEVSGDKVRRRYDWRRWILPPNLVFPTERAIEGDKQQQSEQQKIHNNKF